MGKAVPRMADIARRLLADEKIGTPAAEGYFPRGLLINEAQEKTGAERVVDLLLLQASQRTLRIGSSRAAYDRVKPAPPVSEIRTARIALVTDGGLVPKGNPDRIESLAATRYGTYDIAGVEALSPATMKSTTEGMTRCLQTGPEPARSCRCYEGNGSRTVLSVHCTTGSTAPPA